MECRTPVVFVHHQLLELAQTHVHRVSDAIQPSQLCFRFSNTHKSGSSLEVQGLRLLAPSANCMGLIPTGWRTKLPYTSRQKKKFITLTKYLYLLVFEVLVVVVIVRVNKVVSKSCLAL